jgi:hypothetical protein
MMSTTMYFVSEYTGVVTKKQAARQTLPFNAGRCLSGRGVNKLAIYAMKAAFCVLASDWRCN